MLLCRAEDKVALFDVQQRSTLAELATPPIKYAVWSADMGRVALLRWAPLAAHMLMERCGLGRSKDARVQGRCGDWHQWLPGAPDSTQRAVGLRMG